MHIIKRKLNILKKEDRLVIFSLFTKVDRNFHLDNEAIEFQINQEMQNFEYKT